MDDWRDIILKKLGCGGWRCWILRELFRGRLEVCNTEEVGWWRMEVYLTLTKFVRG